MSLTMALEPPAEMGSQLHPETQESDTFQSSGNFRGKKKSGFGPIWTQTSSFKKKKIQPTLDDISR